MVIQNGSKPMQMFVLGVDLNQVSCSGGRKAQAVGAWLAFLAGPLWTVSQP